MTAGYPRDHLCPDAMNQLIEAAMKTPALLSALAVLTACVAAAPAMAEPTVVV